MNHCSDNLQLDYKSVDAMDIVSLLQNEELLVSSERKYIQKLNKEVNSYI